MSAPTALETIRTGAPDNSTGLLIANISAQESATTEIPAGVALSDRIAAAPSAHRAAMSAIDSATDMSTVGFAGTSGANLDAINNRGAIVIWCEFANTAGAAGVRVVYYDSSNNPLFVGPILSFAALAQRVSASGDYMSTPQLVDSYGASKFRCFLATIGTGNVDIFAHPI